MTSTATRERRTPAPASTPTRLPYLAGVGTLFALEMRQRLRSRGWYIMLAIWFVVVLGVTLAVGAAVTAAAEAAASYGDHTPRSTAGQVQFELVACFVLGLGALIAPAFAANSISGDRAGGTLAIVQATLVTPGQILWGKWLAAWVAALAFLVAALPAIAVALLNGLDHWGTVFLALPVIALELGVMCGIGVALSAATNRPLFSVLVTYLVIGVLFIGTLVAAGIGAMTVTTTVRESTQASTPAAMKAYEEWDALVAADPERYANEEPPEAAMEMVCDTSVNEYQAPATDRFAWFLSANPLVLLADMAAPAPQVSRITSTGGYVYDTLSQAEAPMSMVRALLRQMQAGPQAQVTCLEGKIMPVADLKKAPPVWPLGLAAQLVIVAGLVAIGRRRLVTPAGRLPKGMRVA